MKQQVLAFWHDEEGATAVEYALIVGMIAVAVITVYGALGTKLEALFTSIFTKIGNEVTPPPG